MYRHDRDEHLTAAEKTALVLLVAAAVAVVALVWTSLGWPLPFEMGQ